MTSAASEEFARAVVKKSVAKICVELGYTSINGSSLQVMVDLVTNFFAKFGVLMRVNAEDYCERTFNEVEDAFYALDQLGMSVEELFECVREFNPGTLGLEVPLFPVPIPPTAGGGDMKNADFFDPSTAEEEDIKASVEAAQNKQALKEASTITPKTSPLKSQLLTEKNKSNRKLSESSPTKPVSISLSQTTPPGVLRTSISPISADLAPVTSGGMLPTSVTLTYEESEFDSSKAPILTPKKVFLLKQSLLKKPDQVEIGGENLSGTVSRKLRLGIDAGVSTTTKDDREKSPPPKDTYVPEIKEVGSKASAESEPPVSNVESSTNSGTENPVSSSTKPAVKEAEPTKETVLVKTLPIPPANAKPASAVDYETETEKVVEVRGMIIKKVKTDKALPVLHFPSMPLPKKKYQTKKKEESPKMQFKLGSLLTEKQKMKLSAQIQQEQESTKPSGGSGVKSEGGEESSEISSQFSQEEEDTSEMFDDTSADSSYEDIEISEQQESTEFNPSQNPVKIENIESEEEQQENQESSLLPRVVDVKSCANEEQQEELEPRSFELKLKEENSEDYEDKIESCTQSDSEELQTPMIPDTPDLSTPKDKFSTMFITPLLVSIKEEDSSRVVPQLASNLENVHESFQDEGLDKRPRSPEIDIGLTVTQSANEVKEEVLDLGEETDAESDVEKPCSPDLDLFPTSYPKTDLPVVLAPEVKLDPPSLLRPRVPVVTIESDGEIEIPPSPDLIPLSPSTSTEIPRSPNLDADLNSGPNSVGVTSPTAEYNPAQIQPAYHYPVSTTTTAPPEVFGGRKETIFNPPSPNLVGGDGAHLPNSEFNPNPEKVSKLDSVLDFDFGIQFQDEGSSVEETPMHHKTKDKEKSSGQSKKRKHTSEHKSKKKHKKMKKEYVDLVEDEEDESSFGGFRFILKFGGKSVTLGEEGQSEDAATVSEPTTAVPDAEMNNSPEANESVMDLLEPSSGKKTVASKKQKEDNMRDLLANAELMQKAAPPSLTIKAPSVSSIGDQISSPITPVGIRDSDFTNTSPNLPPLVGTANPDYYHPTPASSSTALIHSAGGVIKLEPGGTDVLGAEPGGAGEGQEWICPGCGFADNGHNPMIGCDQCDAWYHWQCLGITEEPPDEKWFCPKCKYSKSNKSAQLTKKKSKKSSSKRK